MLTADELLFWHKEFILKLYCGKRIFYYFCFVENLVKYISHLVARHDCVIMPGTGAFLAVEEPAHYNVKEGIFIPPYRTMHFNPNVKVDDALLLSEYIDNEQLGYEEATKKMNREIESLHNALKTTGIVRFGELGTFHMNINGGITFEVDANGIEDPANFGFEPFAVPMLRDFEEKKFIISRRDIGKFVAAAAAIILTFIFVTPMSDRAFKQNMQASVTGFASSEQISMMQQLSAIAPCKAVAEVENCEIAPLDAHGNIIVTEESARSNTANEIASEIAPATQEITVHVKNEKVFHIIVASSPNEDNARLAIKELSAKKEAAYNVVKGGGRHRISIGEYSTNKEAATALEEIKTTFPDAWIFQTNAL